MTEEKLNIQHTWVKDSTESMCQKVDDNGGWPHGMVSLKFAHTDDRFCEFSADYNNSGWWTVCLKRDEYYWWKISAGFKKKIIDEIRSDIRSRI